MNPTVYVHDLDPVIWQITDSIALRWYGLAYLMGFIGGYYLLSWLSRRKLYPVPQDRMADFVTYVAILVFSSAEGWDMCSFTRFPITAGPSFWRIRSWY